MTEVTSAMGIKGKLEKCKEDWGTGVGEWKGRISVLNKAIMEGLI